MKYVSRSQKRPDFENTCYTHTSDGSEPYKKAVSVMSKRSREREKRRNKLNRINVASSQKMPLHGSSVIDVLVWQLKYSLVRSFAFRDVS